MGWYLVAINMSMHGIAEEKENFEEPNANSYFKSSDSRSYQYASLIGVAGDSGTHLPLQPDASARRAKETTQPQGPAIQVTNTKPQHLPRPFYSLKEDLCSDCQISHLWETSCGHDTMPPKRALGDVVKPDKAAKLRQAARTTHEGGTTEGSLCSQCSKLELETMFSKETISKAFGFLERFMDSTCPFCTIIWDCIRLHRGTTSPLENGARPRLYVQSKRWRVFTVAGDSVGERHMYRILLALTEQPPKFRFNRKLVSTDKRNRFLLGEVELLKQRTLERSLVPALRREVEPLLDANRLRGWLQACQQHEYKFALDHDLSWCGVRLTDVVEARLVEVMNPCEYIALSYVWGPHNP